MILERRKYPRIPSDQLVSFTPFAGALSLGQGGNVSLGGIRFQAVGCAFRSDELLCVSFNLQGQTVEAVGRVVWTKALDEISSEVGLEFLRIDPWAARLLEEEVEGEAGA